MKGTRRHVGSAASLRCVLPACWRLGAAGRAGAGRGSAPSPLSPAQGSALGRPFRPHRPGQLQTQSAAPQFQTRRGTRLFGEAQKAEPWIAPSSATQAIFTPIPHRKIRGEKARAATKPGPAPARPAGSP